MPDATFTFLFDRRKKVTFTAEKIYRTTREIVVYDGETSRDELFAAQLGNAHKTPAQQPNSKAAQTAKFGEVLEAADPNNDYSRIIATVNGAMVRVTDGAGVTTDSLPVNGFESPAAAGPVVVNGAETSYAPTQLSDSAHERSDSYNHIKPRDRWKLRTLVEYWSGAAVGRAQKMTGTTTNNSAEVTVPDVGTLVIGQKVSGTNIPTDAHIVAFKRPTEVTDSSSPVAVLGTTIILSHNATGAATTELTFTGSDLIAACWLDEDGPVTNGAITQLY